MDSKSMSVKKKNMLERLKQNRLSRSRKQISQKDLRKSRSVSPRPKQKLKEPASESTVKQQRNPVSRFDDDAPKRPSSRGLERQIASPFNESKQSGSVG